MNLRKIGRVAAAWLAASVASASALAAEMTLYQHQGFKGEQLTLRGQAANVGQYRFNDKASSVVVRSGRWLVCTDAGFKGRCAELVPGEYPALEGQFNDRISSARAIAGRGMDSHRQDERGAIKFFDQTVFRGRAMDLQNAVSDFRQRGYNDRASSIIVARGVWELCSGTGFGGNCRLYGPGRYADLGPGMANRVSSARQVHAQAGRRWNTHSGIELYTAPAFRGQAKTVASQVRNLSGSGFNDRVGSLVVNAGEWELCTDAGFAGACTVFGPGAYANLGWLSAQLSSVRQLH